MKFLHIVNASPGVLSASTVLHWLRVPQAMNVLLSASERQSGVVREMPHHNFRSSSETRYQSPPDLCCSLCGPLHSSFGVGVPTNHLFRAARANFIGNYPGSASNRSPDESGDATE
jgi:hypothetical protein